MLSPSLLAKDSLLLSIITYSHFHFHLFLGNESLWWKPQIDVVCFGFELPSIQCSTDCFQNLEYHLLGSNKRQLKSWLGECMLGLQMGRKCLEIPLSGRSLVQCLVKSKSLEDNSYDPCCSVDFEQYCL
ncbi:hypothetical protein MtrunA17_Chr7g0255041 [Medicago truncatula]|uniref:Uncharacterized protein n=1 Tax=Medicago truncatula TaxID=3880 RepID=Q2HUI0_MEDTR|nr:hypothetical protein MtrDRAFT_AC149134g10v2 [Medicago truncatula]RHN47629.1 hypothetical protein MtrunA17_Chr7g0255041 [Medicago truncatula]